MARAIIAVSGKGGVGKTSISAMVVRALCQAHPEAKVLAIDADPAIGLSSALGVDVHATLDDIRRRIVKNVEEGEPRAAVELLSEAKYLVFDTMVEGRDFAFLAIGRPETAGCYCAINSYLKEVISHLSESFDYVIIDGEAGVEQINRRVMEKVSHLLLVSDQSRKGFQVVNMIQGIAKDMVLYEKAGLILNRIKEPELLEGALPEQLDLLACISEDPHHARNDILGNSVFDLPESSPLACGVVEALQTLELISQEKEVSH